MQVVCLDIEGVLVPEIWIEFSKRTGIAELARNAGFSRVSIEPLERLNRSVKRPGRAPVNANFWNLYVFEK